MKNQTLVWAVKSLVIMLAGFMVGAVLSVMSK